MAPTSQRPIYLNPLAKSWRAPATTAPDLISAFHQSLPQYAVTRLVSLQKLADEMGVRAIYLKDEGKRFGLPSFKILGASWGIFRALTQRLGLSLSCDLQIVKEALLDHPFTLCAATDGNHGRAVARMAKYLDLKVEIYVPTGVDFSTAQAIRQEGAIVIQISGSYDLAVNAAFEAVKNSSSRILIQDTSFSGYEEIPQWIVEGYSTMMLEIDEQLEGQRPDLVIAPVGVGSFAQAVVTHCKGPGNGFRVLTVEADSTACLYESLSFGEVVILEDTAPTIMTGMDCGTVSSNAWPILQAGIDVSCSISDFEAHAAVDVLCSLGVLAGPCGAAPLAALHRLTSSDKVALGLDESSVIVLCCTEGPRDYLVPPEHRV